MSRPRAEKPTFSLTLRAGRYYVQWWEDGAARRISCRTGVTSEARRFLAEFEAGRNAPAPPDAPTIGAILDGYQADRELRPVSPSFKYTVDTLKSVLGDLPADLFGKERARYYLATRRENGAGGVIRKRTGVIRPLADATLRRDLLILRASLRWAQREGWIPEVRWFDIPPPGQSKDRWLTREEAAALVLATRHKHMRLFISTALYTAGRTGAILELTWDRVDFTRGTVDLGRGQGNKRRACVPMHPKLRPLLLDAAASSAVPWVISVAGRGLKSIDQGFKAAVVRAGLQGVTPHVLRHTAATWMAQRGVPLGSIAAYLGNSASIVEKVYVHHTPEHMGAASAALDD